NGSRRRARAIMVDRLSFYMQYTRIHRFARLFILTLSVLMLLHPGGVAQAATSIRGPVVVRPGGAQLYSAPDGEVVATLPTSTVFTASGRTEDAQWVVGQTATGNSGWLQVAQVIA